MHYTRRLPTRVCYCAPNVTGARCALPTYPEQQNSESVRPLKRSSFVQRVCSLAPSDCRRRRDCGLQPPGICSRCVVGRTRQYAARGVMSLPKITLLTFEGCPNAAAARKATLTAIARAGRPVEFTELDLLASDTPVEYRRYPSPTVLVGECDVSGDGDDVQGSSCRASGAPSVAQIHLALETWSRLSP